MQEAYDVAILGSGLCGSVLASILGRQGFRVLLLEALRADDFAPARFEHPRRLQAALLDANDRMVFNSYRSFGSYATWMFDFDPSVLGGPVPTPVEDLSAVPVMA